MTKTATHSRAIALGPEQIRPGDLVDLSTTATPYWVEVTGLMSCEDDPEWAEHCEYDGFCELVLKLWRIEEPDPEAWHVRYEHPINVRVAAA